MHADLCPCVRDTQPPTQLSESWLLRFSPLKVRPHHHVRWSLFIPARLPTSFSPSLLGDWLNVGHFSCHLPNECLDSSPALDVSLHVCVCDTREHMHALKWISSLAIRLHAFLMCLQVRRRKHVMRSSLNPTIIFVQSCAAHYLMVHRNSSMPTVEIVLPDTVPTKKSPRQTQGVESVAIIINPFKKLFKILCLLKDLPSLLPCGFSFSFNILTSLHISSLWCTMLGWGTRAAHVCTQSDTCYRITSVRMNSVCWAASGTMWSNLRH